MNALEEVLLWCGTQIPRSGTPATDPRVQAARTYIQEHLGEKLSLDALAETAGLSASRLTQLFRRETGTTPLQYIELRRLERAQQLLARTTMTVGMIAQEVGFENPFYFTLRFKRSLGLAPTEFRKQIETE
jgi:AraC family transcriptional regulator of arabinose operon